MAWFGRTRDPGPPDDEPSEPAVPERSERSAPGLGALFDGLHEDGRHTVLDLASASPEGFRVLGRFARRIRFAGLLDRPGEVGEWASTLERIPTYPGRPYDVVLAWNLLDRMPAEERPAVVRALVRASAPGARLYVVGDTTGAATAPPLRHTLLDTNRVAEEPAGPSGPVWPDLLPATMEKLLDPFRVEQAFVLRAGWREYVAMRPSD